MVSVYNWVLGSLKTRRHIRQLLMVGCKEHATHRVHLVCRAAVIDEIELASQMDSNVFNTGSGKETEFLPPFLHTLKATETTNLERIQWGGKLRETKDMLAKIEQTMAAGFERLHLVRPSDACTPGTQHSWHKWPLFQFTEIGLHYKMGVCRR